VTPLLAVEDIHSYYGKSHILHGISLEVGRGEVVGLLGRNGVGKSTLLLTLMGCTRLHRGALLWQGRDISRLPPHRRARLGIGWVAQEREIFPSLTVQENLTVAARPGDWTLERVYALFPRLAERRTNRGNQLSGGEQQMLAIARALMINPALLLLDEPLEGLAPIIVEELVSALRNVEGMAMILVEQHAEIALSLSAQALVIERGRIAHAGASAELLANQALLERYVGVQSTELS